MDQAIRLFRLANDIYRRFNNYLSIDHMKKYKKLYMS